MFERLNEEWDDEYTVKSLKEFLNSPYIDDDFPVRLGISEWNFSKSCNFYAKQITSFGKPFVCLESMEINNDYNKIYDKWFDKKIENNILKKENKELKEENEQLKSDNNRLVKQTAEKVAEHQQRILDLIDEKIIELEKYDEIRDDDWYIGQIDVLKNLKKELTE